MRLGEHAVYWRCKLADTLLRKVGPDVHELVMQGNEELTSESSDGQVVDWIAGTVRRLQSCTDRATARNVLNACGCAAPAESFEQHKAVYEDTGDLDAVMDIFRADLETFLRDRMGIEDHYVDEALSRGWGWPGVRNGNTITLTKIPWEGSFREYFDETDPEEQRKQYCHCPIVRAAMRLGKDLPSAFCNCGGGHYTKSWGAVLGKPVVAEKVCCILGGDDLCTSVIHLPV